MTAADSAALDERLEQVVDRLDELEAENERLREENRELKEENENLRERVEDLEREAKILESRCDGLANGLDELEQRLADGDLAKDVDRGADPDVPRETPLEDVVALPDDVAERELDPNVERARWFATEAKGAGRKTPAGYQLTAGQIGRLLDVSLSVEPHPQTVARIISVLDEMGKDETVRRKRAGEKRIILEEDLADRLEAHAEMRQGEG